MLGRCAATHVAVPDCGYGRHDEVERLEVLLDLRVIAQARRKPSVSLVRLLDAEENPDAGEQVRHIHDGEEEYAQAVVRRRYFQAVM